MSTSIRKHSVIEDARSAKMTSVMVRDLIRRYQKVSFMLALNQH